MSQETFFQFYFQLKVDLFIAQRQRHKVHLSQFLEIVQMHEKRERSVLAQSGGLSTHIYFFSF